VKKSTATLRKQYVYTVFKHMYKGINRPKVCRLHSIFTQTQCIPLLSSYNIGSKGVKGGFSQPLNTLVGMTGGSATSWRGLNSQTPTNTALM